MPHEASFRDALREYIREAAKPIEKFSHQPRLYALTQLISKGIAYDDDVVFAAAWLHDLGVFVGHRPEEPEELARWDSLTYACEKAPEVLIRLGFTREKIPLVVEAIRTHQPSGDPRSLEAAVLRDADILEQLGSVGILRAVCKIGRDTRYPTFSDVLPVLRYAVNVLPSQLRLEPARELAKNRVLILQQFLEAVQIETAGQVDLGDAVR